MLHSEIIETVDRTGAKPRLDTDAATNVVVFDEDQWVSYDDDETLRLKVEFAQQRCLGGVMAWAVSSDVRDARLSKALGNAVGPAFKGSSSSANSHKSIDTRLAVHGSQQALKHPQCMWTNCGDGE